MKKALSLILALVLCLSLGACGSNTDASNPTNGKVDNPNTDTNASTNDTTENTTDNKEALYTAVIEKINLLVGNSQDSVSLTEEDATYLIDELTALGDYKDSKKIVGRFACFSNMRVFVEEVTADKMGNQTKETIARYEYDSNGRLVGTTDEHVVEQYGIEVPVGYPSMTISYNDNRHINEIVIKSFGTINTRATPTYDENGNISSMLIINNYAGDVEATAFYKYDGQNRLISSKIPVGSISFWDYSFVYDENNQLVKKSAIRTYSDGSTTNSEGTSYSKEIEYFYENGKLVEEKRTEITDYKSSWWGEDKCIITTYSYNYNADGLIEKATITTDNPDVKLTSWEWNYNYSNLYFYKPQK